MFALFCLRLGCGLAGCLLLLPRAVVNPRFYRAVFLTVLGLSAAAAAFLNSGSFGLWVALGGALVCSFLGSLAWSLEYAPLGKTSAVLVTLCLILVLAQMSLLPSLDERASSGGEAGWLLLATQLSSAALLGTATTAMLMGHSYLSAPSLSLVPLFRLLGALFSAILARAALAGLGLWFWSAEHSLGHWNDVTLLLPLRWGLGFLAPLVLAALAWQSARIRSTQSATGILYVLVIFCFLGELLSQLLQSMTSFVL
jgi:hypothetical protein